MTDMTHSKASPSSQSAAVAPIITWDGAGNLVSNQFEDTYCSLKDGLAESRYVFLKHNQLTQRFKDLTENASFVVAEAGFGTGLNFLSCWQHWLKNAPNSAQLSFISVDKYPLLPADLKRSLATWPSLANLADELCQSYEAGFTSSQTPQYKSFSFGNVRLLLLVDDAEQGFKQLLHSHDAQVPPDTATGLAATKPSWGGVDAWFLDGFSPAKNPAMWTKSLFNTMALLSKKTTTFSTYTSASAVRCNLGEAGFDVVKAPGFGRKRELLYGTFSTDRHKTEELSGTGKNLTAISSLTPPAGLRPHKKSKRSVNLTPWAVVDNFQALQKDQSVAIIGAGLAGCHTANALAKRGFKVTLIDRHETIASAASGNPQGVLYAKLSAHAQTLSDFNLQALLHAQHFYRDYWKDVGDRCGVLQLSYNDSTRKNHHAINSILQAASAIKFVNAKQASAVANVAIQHSALYFPLCGWLKPQVLCQKLCNHKNITVLNNTLVESLVQSDDSAGWLLKGVEMPSRGLQHEPTKTTTLWTHSFDRVVIANAADASRFEQTSWLPIKSVRGQISYLKSQAPYDQLQSVICAEGYIPPATGIAIGAEVSQIHALGASFNLHSDNKSLSEDDHLNNLTNTAKYFTDTALTPTLGGNATDAIHTPDTSTKLAIEGGRVGFRCTSPDYLPLVGPAPIYDQFKESYSPLSRDAKTFVPKLGSYFPGLYINVAHGSRGLAYTPITAELLACTIASQPLPISQATAAALNPARFIIRDLIRSNK
jgi:tRNA 5-methylaminomethyl-2-thiouridine biosynthesis bifunctional protein